MAQNDPDRLQKVLPQINPDEVTTSDMQLALFAACRHDCFDQVGWMVQHVPSTALHYAILIAAQHDHHRITMLLMLCKAAIEGRVDLIRFLYGEYDEAIRLEPPEWYVSEAHAAMPAAAINTYIPIKMALTHKMERVSLMMSSMRKFTGSTLP